MLGSRNKNDNMGMMKNFHLALKIMIQAIALALLCVKVAEQ